MFKSLILLLLSILFLGCVEKRQLTPLDIVKKTNETATLYFVRNLSFYSSGVHFYPTIDGHDISGLRSNEYTKIITSFGSHELGVRYHYGFSEWKHPTIHMSIKKGKKYFFLLSPTIFGGGEIENISKEEGLNRVKKSKEITPSSISKALF